MHDAPTASLRTPSGATLAERRILVVDDELDIAELACEALAPAMTETAATYEEARQKLATRTYDAAILDIMGVRGMDLLAEFGDRLPCVMLTAHALGSESLRGSIERNAALYLPKSELASLDRHIAGLLEEIASAGERWRQVRERRWADVLERLDFRRWFHVREAGHEWWGELPALLFLRSLDWLQDAPEAELRELARLATRHAVGAGAALDGAGELADLYIVRTGEVQETRADGATLNHQAGDLIAEESALLHVSPSGRLRTQDGAELLRFPHAEVSSLLDRRPSLARAFVGRISRRMDKLERSLRRQLQLLEQRSALLLERESLMRSMRESAVWFFMILGWILVTGGAAAFVARAGTPTRFYAKWLVQILGLTLSVFFILYHREGRRFFGLTLQGWRASLLRATLVTVFVFGPASVISRLVLDHLGMMPPGTPLFHLVPPDLRTMFYALIVVPLQEIGHRGVIQTYVRELCGGGRFGSAAAIGFAAVVFAYGHLLTSPLFAFITFLAGLTWGIEFEKDRTLVGVMVSHALVGWLALSCFSLSGPFGTGS